MVPLSLLAAVYGAALVAPPVKSVDTLTKEKARLEASFFDVSYDHAQLAESMNVLEGENGIWFVQAKRLCHALGFRLNFSLVHHRITGFLRRPSDKLTLDWETGRWRGFHRHGRIRAAEMMMVDTELYMTPDAFDAVFGVQLSRNPHTLEIEVESNDPLSTRKLSIWRSIQAQRVSVMPSAFTSPQPTDHVPHVSPQYRLFSTPYFGANVSTNFDRPDHAGLQGSSASVSAYGDFLYLDSSAQLISSPGLPSQAQFQLGRDDPNGHLFGSLHATHFSFGNGYMPPIPLLVDDRLGSGFVVTNAPLADGSGLGTQTVSGRSRPGSQVELYTNDDLIGMATADSSGRYSFTHLPLVQGFNRFNVIEIDDSGSAHQRTVWIAIDPLLAKPGEINYQISADRSRIIDPWLGAGAIMRTQTTAIAQTSYGMTQNVSLTQVAGSLGNVPTYGVGGRVDWNGFSGGIEQLLTGGPGGALEASVSDTIGNQTFSLSRIRHAAYSQPSISGYLPNTQTGTQIEWLQREKSQVMGMAYEFADGPWTYLTAHYGRQFGNSSIDQQMRFTFGWGGTSIEDETSFDWRLRDRLYAHFDAITELGHQLSPGQQSITLSHSLGPAFAVTGTVSHVAGYVGLRPNLALYRLMGPFAIGVTFSGVGTGGLRTGLALSTTVSALGRGVAGLDKPGTANLGHLKARVYVDSVGDGKYHKGDRLLEGIGLKLNGHAFDGRTSKNGVLRGLVLAPNQEYTVSLDEDTLTDPSWVPEIPEIAVLTRSGREAEVDLPVIESGEVNGNISQLPDDNSEGLTATLYRKDKSAVGLSRLDDSGAYAFSGIWPGRYRLVITRGEQVVSETTVMVHSGLNEVKPLPVPAGGNPW